MPRRLLNAHVLACHLEVSRRVVLGGALHLDDNVCVHARGVAVVVPAYLVPKHQAGSSVLYIALDHVHEIVVVPRWVRLL